MFKLIRDKIPEQAKKEGKIFNYASIENNELYTGLLRTKFAEEASEFLNSNDISELADVLTVIKAIIKDAGMSEEDFEKLYQDKLKINGGFEKRYIGFFPDQASDTTKQTSKDKEQ